MTNGYTKMRGKKANRTMSLDFSDLAFSPPPPPSSEKAPTTEAEARHRDGQEETAAGDGGEVFGVILSRTCSSSASSHRFAANNYHYGGAGGVNGAPSGGGLHAAVRRAFSMRKLTSSPAEGYSRIHDTAAAADLADVVDRDSTEEEKARPSKRKNKTKESRVLRACKRLFGF